MTPQQQERLNDIIEELEIVQAQSPTKTTYSMGRADHSISHQLLDIIRHLKALAHDATSEPEREADTEPVRTEGGFAQSRIDAAEDLNATRKARK